MGVERPVARQRAGPLTGLPALLCEFRVSPSRITADLGIDLETLSPDTMIPFAAALTMLERAADETGCAHIGLLLGSRHRWSNHGVIAPLTMTAPTLRRALTDFVTWQIGYSSGAGIYLTRVGDAFALGYGIHDRSEPGSRQAYELVIAIGLNMISALTGSAVWPDEIMFCHSAPKDVSAHARILKAPVRFNQNQCCMLLSANAMARALPGSDPARYAQARRAVGEALGVTIDSPAARLRGMIRPQILKGDPSMAGAARALALHPRTLRRHLAAAGLTFEGVRDDVRFVVARDLLGLTDLSIGEISAALAFSTHSAFVEAFRRWSGMTPTAWRSDNGKARSNLRHTAPVAEPKQEAAGLRPPAPTSGSRSDQREPGPISANPALHR